MWSLFAYIVFVVKVMDSSILKEEVFISGVNRTLKVLCLLMPLGFFYYLNYPILYSETLLILPLMTYWPCVTMTALGSAIYYIPMSVLRDSDVKELSRNKLSI